MGVLDELKKEAEAIAADKARETTARAAAAARARERVAPRMEAAYRYFDELKQHLQVVSREIHAGYDIRGIGRVDGLLQGQYSVSKQSPDALDKFSFRCVCARAGAFQVNQDDTASVAAYRDYLRNNGLKAKVRDTGRGSALFMVEPVIPVVVEFTADYERGAVALRVRNLTALGVSRHTLSLEQVSEILFDEVAKAILRTENRFDQLVGISISDTSKVKLKSKIREAMRQKELEDELARREAAKEDTITRRFSRTLFGRKDGS